MSPDEGPYAEDQQHGADTPERQVAAERSPRSRWAWRYIPVAAGLTVVLVAAGAVVAFRGGASEVAPAAALGKPSRATPDQRDQSASKTDVGVTDDGVVVKRQPPPDHAARRSQRPSEGVGPGNGVDGNRGSDQGRGEENGGRSRDSGTSGDGDDNGGGDREKSPPWPGDGRPMTGTWAEVSSDGRTLTVHFYGGVCSDFYADVDGHSDRVLIEIKARPLPDRPGMACPAIAKAQTVPAKLERPLGDRKVIEMPDREEIPVRGR